MNVTNLDSVVFGVTDLAACRRFWTDFGLTESTAPDGATVFGCKNGSTVVLRSADDPKLPQPIEPGATQREAFSACKSAADLTAIADELERDRPVRVDADGTVHAVDPLGFGIAFRVAQRKPDHGSGAQVQHAGPARPHQYARPVLRVGHAARNDAHGVHDRRARQSRAVLYGAPGVHRERQLSGPRLFPARRRVESSSQPVPAQRGQEARLPSSRVRAVEHSRALRRRPQHDAARLAYRARPRAASDLVVLLLVFPFAVRRRRRVRLRLRCRRRALGARRVPANARGVRRMVPCRGNGGLSAVQGRPNRRHDKEARVDTSEAEQSHHDHEQETNSSRIPSTKTSPARGSSTPSVLARATTSMHSSIP